MNIVQSLKRGTTVLALLVLLAAMPAWAQEEAPPAPMVNDEGGPVVISGAVEYTNPLFTDGVTQPLVILEDQAGFVDRNEQFLMPVESQTLGQITSDFYDSPFTYSLTLPITPRGTYRDVDNDTEEETGVQVFAIAYWNNTFGDPYLEERDLYGGGWSTAYASTRVSSDADTAREIVGGKFLVYAPDDEQAFPSGFGEDGFLFTGDEPVVTLPQGYTIVDMDTDPFTFDRSAFPVVDLIEPEAAAVDDFSGMDYVEAFDAMLAKLRTEYAFTEYKNIDWDALEAEYRPRFEAAETESSTLEYARALRDFLFSIPDGHIAAPPVFEDVRAQYLEGIGLALRQLDDGRVIIHYVLEDGPADQAGIEQGAQLVAINGQPIEAHLSAITPPLAPVSTEHNLLLEQLRWGVRFPERSSVEVTFRNPDSKAETTETLRSAFEWESYDASMLAPLPSGFEPPVEYELLDDGYAYVKIYSFNDNSLLTIQLWERLLQTLNAAGVPGLIIDMRQNGGGSGFLADQMAAYFFQEPLILGNTGIYDEQRDEFYFDPRYENRFYLPPEELRYSGRVAVLISPDCLSACEFFAYDMTLQDRAAIIGHYPTGGLGGSIQDFFMPEGARIRFTAGRAVDNEGNIHIEGRGVLPTIDVPLTEETLFSEDDPLLEAAIAYLEGRVK